MSFVISSAHLPMEEVLLQVLAVALYWTPAAVTTHNIVLVTDHPGLLTLSLHLLPPGCQAEVEIMDVVNHSW